ncbi:MAG: NTP transferase domain-containing protein [Candidatus Omnitrophica bacterium]|nr:NTP transferase domain-containing protein [Candidatus Omnitrophota bacterium]
MNIVIPMSGTGARFIEKGYKTPKPFIEIEGKPIIRHIVERFCPDDRFVLICNEEQIKEAERESILKKLAPNCTVIKISPHKLGPVFAVLQAARHINDDEPTIVNYCDFSWCWDYDHFKQYLISSDCDACVVAYRGFHPHLRHQKNFYASMRDNGRNEMLEIREKYSFTENKMDCFQSSGTYFFKQGLWIKHYFQQLIEKQIDLNGEYYVSLVNNLMVKDGLKVGIYEIPFFLQWGTPEDMEEYICWSNYFKFKNKNSDRK